jgi:cytosine/adenosine deaminase-related metal-dependent hydrolase
MKQNRTVIRDAAIVSMDPEVGDIDRGDILIEGARIAAVGKALAVGDAQEVDALGMIAIPGFIDTHRHTWEAPVHGILANGTHRDYSDVILSKIKDAMRAEDAYAATLAGSIEALDSGVTTLLDWNHVSGHTPDHADASVAALREAGLRAVFAWAPRFSAWEDDEFPSKKSIPEAEAWRLRKTYFSSDDQLVTLALGARGPRFCSPETVAEDWRIARDVGMRITFHVGIDGVGPEVRSWHPVQDLHDQGLMGPDTTYIHCCTCTDHELKLMADTGGTASVAASVEMQMGIGVPPVGRLLDAGVRPSLSVDVVVATPGELFTQMRVVYNTQRLLDYMENSGMLVGRGEQREDWTPRVETRDVLEFATIAGARANGMEHKTGSLKPGKEADIVLIRTDGWNMMPVADPVGAVVNFATPADVDTVFVAGKMMKRGGKLLHVDRAKVMRDSMATREHMLSSWRKPDGTYDKGPIRRLSLPGAALTCGGRLAAGLGKARAAV